jgi:hypothetical protein
MIDLGQGAKDPNKDCFVQERARAFVALGMAAQKMGQETVPDFDAFARKLSEFWGIYHKQAVGYHTVAACKGLLEQMRKPLASPQLFKTWVRQVEKTLPRPDLEFDL